MNARVGRPPGFRKYLYDLRTFPGDAWLAWQLGGWSGVWLEVRERIIFRIYRAGRFLVFEQDLALFREAPPPAGVRVEVFTGDWSHLRPILGRRKVDLFRMRAAAGRDCIVAWRGDRPIGYTWSSDRIDASIEYYPLPLPSDATYGWDLFVILAERNHGIGAALGSARLRLARDRGKRTAWRVIAPDNIASRRSLEKLGGEGYRMIGEIVTKKVLRRTLARFIRYETPLDPRGEPLP